jgi:hypothetical protein
VDIAAMAGTAANMPRPPTLRADTVTHVQGPRRLSADTLVSVLGANVVTILRGPRGVTPALQGARIIGIWVATGEAVTGEAVTRIHPMDIRDLAITAGAMALHITGLAITVPAMAGAMIRTTDIIPADTTLTGTDTGLICLSVSASTKLSHH